MCRGVGVGEGVVTENCTTKTNCVLKTLEKMSDDDQVFAIRLV